MEAIGAKDLDRALLLIMNVIERKLDSKKTPVMRLPGVDKFKGKGTGFGIRWFCQDKSSFRFNFAKNKIGGNEVDSIDIFTPQKGMTPAAHIATKGISLAKIIPLVAKQINSPKPGKYTVDIFEEENEFNLKDSLDLVVMTEAMEFTIDGEKFATKGAAKKALRAKGYAAKQVKQMLTQEVIVTSGSPETNNIDVKKSETLVQKVEIDPNDVLDKHIPAFVSGVAKGLAHTLIIAGTPGIGKSYGIDKQLSSMYGPDNAGKNPNWAIYKGKVSLAAVFELLFKQNGKVLVFDDADSVFASEDAVNLLKAALDTKQHRYVTMSTKSSEYFDPQNPPYFYENIQLSTSLGKSLKQAEMIYKRENQVKGQIDPDEKSQIREIVDISVPERYNQAVKFGRIPKTFEFTGSAIFVSNRKLSKIDSAIRDRSLAPIELDMSRSQIIDRIERILEHLKPGDDGENVGDLSMSDKQEVLDWYRETMIKYNRNNLSLRSFKTAMKYYMMDSSNWKELVELYVGL
jgi:hypothetical protein